MEAPRCRLTLTALSFNRWQERRDLSRAYSYRANPRCTYNMKTETKVQYTVFLGERKRSADH
jgi:hypothetical protein